MQGRQPAYPTQPAPAGYPTYHPGGYPTQSYPQPAYNPQYPQNFQHPQPYPNSQMPHAQHGQPPPPYPGFSSNPPPQVTSFTHC